MRRNTDDRRVLLDNEETPATSLDNSYENEISFTDDILEADDESSFHHSQSKFRQTVVISEAPLDRGYFTCLVFSLLGVSTMTPWNFFITAEDYWMYKFRNTSSDGSHDPDQELTPMQKSFTCDLTLTASISGTIFLILHAIYGQKFSLTLRMLGTSGVILVLFLFTTAFVEVNTDSWQEQFFLLTMLTVLILNVCSAVMCGALFGFAGLFPSSYMSAVVSGQALGGIFTALTFVVVLAFGTDPKTTALIYFSIGSFLVLLSIAAYIIMSRRAFFNYYMNGGDKLIVPQPETATTSHRAVTEMGVALEPNIKVILGKIYVEAVGICIIFATSLSVYPAVSVLMQSQNYGHGNAWSDIYYMPVANYVLFNCGDYFGRVMAGIINKPHKNAHTVLLMTILRILFVPLFLCSNTNLHHFLPILVQQDATFMVMVACFGISNGYLTNIFLMMAPRAVMQHEREIASAIMAAFLSGGLVIGSILSMGFVQLL